MHRLSVLLILVSLGSAPALADQNGVPVTKPYACSSDALSALSFVCDGLKSIGVKACTVTGDSCVNASQELFSGLNIEFATPGNIKNARAAMRSRTSAASTAAHGTRRRTHSP